MILIATPTRDQLYAGFTYDLVQLVGISKDAVFSIVQGTLLSNLRNLSCRAAVQSGATHILFIDSDMRFPPDALKRLLARDVDIVGANCKQRTVNEWTARKNDAFISSDGQSGIEEVDTLGMGVTLIKTDALKKLAEPWFHMPYDGNKHVGEDIYFCTMARESGMKVFVDHDLSQQVKHAGLVEFGL